MPKQIKKKELKAGEKPAAVVTVIAMAAGLVFAALFIILIPDIDSSTEQVQFVKAIRAAAGYVLFVLISILAVVLNLRSYNSSKQMGDAMRAFFAGVSVFTALLSIRFMLALFFAGLDNRDMVDKIIGDNSYSQFIQNQAPSFACLVIALSVMLFTGISAIVKLASR